MSPNKTLRHTNAKMNTKYLMIATSIVMGLAGLAATFFPKEIAGSNAIPPTELTILCIQIIGGIYIGFAIMNWMAKTVLIGGIYSRPLSMGNFLHFAIVGLALLKTGINNSNLKHIWVFAIMYLIFAILFGIVLSKSPQKK